MFNKYPRKYKTHGLVFKISGCSDEWVLNQCLDNYFNDHYNTVIDIGAHYGAFSLACARDGANVIAVEASNKNYDILIDSINRNPSRGRILPIHACVSNENGISSLSFLKDANSGQNSVLYKEEIALGHYLVANIKLADLCGSLLNNISEISCIKMDIEGKEFDVLMAPDNKRILKKVRYLDIDIHRLDNTDYFDVCDIITPNELLGYLSELGFFVMLERRTSGRPTDKEVGDGNFLLKNINCDG